MLEDIIHRRILSKVRKPSTNWNPSSLVNSFCPRREMLYKLIYNKRYQKDFSLKVKMIMEAGTAIHSEWQNNQLTDVLYGYWLSGRQPKHGEKITYDYDKLIYYIDDKLCGFFTLGFREDEYQKYEEIRLNLSFKDINISGKLDGIIYDEYYRFTDIKSDRSYITTKRKDAKEEHLLQVMLYIYMIQNGGLPSDFPAEEKERLLNIKKASILYVGKDDYLIREFVYDYDKEVVEEMLDKLSYVCDNVLVDVDKFGCPDAGNRYESCPIKDTCDIGSIEEIKSVFKFARKFL